MAPGFAKSRAVWILPIVLVVCGLMVVPASAVLLKSGSEGAASSVSPAGELGGHVAQGSSVPGSTPGAGIANSFSNPILADHGSVPRATPGQTASAVNAIDSAIRTLETRGGNPASIAMLGRLAAGIRDGTISPLVAQLPNINVLLGQTGTPGASVAPFYTTTPAPMGIGDFGVGTSTYELNTSAIHGSLTLSAYNATGGSLYQDSGAYYWNGQPANSEGSPYDSGIQLNTVLANVTFPGSSSDPLGSGVFWTQNVPEFFGNNITFLDNIWNFSAPGAVLNTGTLYSYDGVLVPGEFYYDYGPTIPVAFPLTLNLYNNATVNSYGQDVLTYGYRLVEGTAPAKVYTGIYDTIIFNSLGGGLTLKPQFRIDGYSYTPNGAYFDAELVFCGPADGSNAVITNASGQMSLAYLNSSGKTWDAPASAYDYGTNTGETSIGVAATWSGTTVSISQGPSILYGLWGTPSGVGVPAGADRFSGTLSPIYGFAFIGEFYGGLTYFPAYAPSTATGVVSTFLPPTPPTGWTDWGLEAYADEYANLSANFTVPQTSYSIALSSQPGTLNAPLYMNGEAQATALVKAVTGGTASPYTFSNLVLKVDPYAGYLNATFNLLNDWGFPLFNLVYTTGLTTPVLVNHVAQGPNWGPDTVYTYPYGPYYQYNLPNASQQFVDYGGVGDSFTNLYLPCFLIPAGLCLGGAISLWGTNGVTVNNITAAYGSFGVWASNAPNTKVENSVGTGYSFAYISGVPTYFFGNAFTVVASSGAIAWNVTGTYYSYGIYDMGGTAGSFTYINATEYGFGLLTFWANDSKLTDVYTGTDGVGAVIVGGTDFSVSGVWANYYGRGIATENTESDITISGVTATNESAGVFLESNSNGVSVSGVSAATYSVGVESDSNVPAPISGTIASEFSVGVLGYGAVDMTATGTHGTDQSIAVLLIDTSAASVTDTSVSDLSTGVLALYTTGSSISGVSATNATLSGLYSAPGEAVSYYWLGAYFPFAAVVSWENEGLGVWNVTATTYAAAFFDYDSDGATVGTLNATDGSYGVVLNATFNSLFTNINTYQDWQGVVMGAPNAEFYTEYNTITMSRFVDDTSYGVALYSGAYDNLVWNNAFIGNNGATTTYSSAHIQAYSAEPYNDFYYCSNYNTCTSGVGNYWADWHTYGPNGYLAPYAITGGVYDEYPIGPQETFTVTFTETGLSSGTNWSVTFNGATHSSTTSTITFTATLGTYTFSVNGVQGYQLQSGPTGSVILTGQPALISVVYTSTAPLATQSTVNGYFSVALIIAIIALVLALLALLWKRGGKKPETAPAPPTPWTPPSGAAGGPTSGPGAGGTTGGGGQTWSEGSGGGAGTPPSS